MNARAASIQGILALLGLLAAYLTWQRDPSPAEGHTIVLDITKRNLEKVRYEDGDDWVELSPAQDGDFIWVHLSGRKGSSMALPSGHPVVQTAVPDRKVRGNESAERMWELFAPLTASRDLGVLDEETLESVKLDDAKKRILVTHGGITSAFTITDPPAGATAPYMRAEDSGRVYVVAPQILTDFKAAKSNMVERRLHDFRMVDVDEVVIKAGEQTHRFAYRRAEDGIGGSLVPKGPDGKAGTADQTASNWHDRIFGLFPAEVLGKDETPASGEPTRVLRIEYLYRGDRIGWLELARAGDTSETAAAGETPRTEAMARSEFTAGWMRLSLDAHGLLSEGETLFGSAADSGEKSDGTSDGDEAGAEGAAPGGSADDSTASE